MKSQVQSKTWVIYLILGIMVLILGGDFLANPLATLSTVSFLTGLFFVIAGITSAITIVIERKETSKWLVHLILNILLIVMGSLMIAKLRFTISFLWLFTGLGFAIEAAMVIIRSLHFRKLGDKGWVLMMIFGVLTGIFALLILGNPILEMFFIATIVAAGVICFGIYLLVIAFQLKPNKQ